jgi:hypothetical protein
LRSEGRKPKHERHPRNRKGGRDFWAYNGPQSRVGAVMDLDERDHETFEKGGRAADAAMAKLMKTPPTTLAGMRAIIQYLVDWVNDSGYYYLPTLLRSPILAAYPRRAARRPPMKAEA